MAGGTFEKGVSKSRPGLYVNFKSAALSRIESGERGTVVIPIICSWGESKVFKVIEKDQDIFENFGHKVTEPEMIYIREAMKRANKIIAYRLNNGVNATATWGTPVITANANYSGVKGNNITIKCTDISESTKKTVETYFNMELVDEQVVENIEELKVNGYVTFSGTGTISATAGTTLSGGTDTGVTDSDYLDFMDQSEVQDFDTIALPVDVSSLKATFTNFIKRLRDDEGKKVVGVLSGYDSDYEGIINVSNGVILDDGTELSAIDSTVWVAAAAAGANITESLTYSKYIGAVDVSPRMTHSEYKEALKSGKFVFQFDGAGVKVEQDINSLMSFTPSKGKMLSKNRIIRTLDAINNDLTRVFRDSYIGKLDNNEDGHAILSSAVDNYFLNLQNAGAIKNFVPGKDFVIDINKSIGDEVYAVANIQPVDSMEKIYFEVKIN